MIDASDLWVEVAAYRCASSNVGLHDIANDLDSLAVLKYRWIIVCLADYLIPLKTQVSNCISNEAIWRHTAWFGYDMSSAMSLSC